MTGFVVSDLKPNVFTEGYELRPSDEPQPKLLDAEVVTSTWPMPPVRKWTPMPRATVRERLMAIFFGRYPT